MSRFQDSMVRLMNTFLIVFIIAGLLNLSDIFLGYRIKNSFEQVFTVNEEAEEPASYQSEGYAENLDDYLYRNLSDDEKSAYNSIYNAIKGFKGAVYVPHIVDSEKVFSMVNLVLSEHPELFWCVGECGYSPRGLLSLEYVYSKSEAMEKKKLIEAKADEILSGISGDEYTRSLAIFDYIILNTRYEKVKLEKVSDLPPVSTIEGVLLNNKAICAGYAKAYQYLLQRSGMSAMYVVGMADNKVVTDRHGWVAQRIDGKYYYSDPTWGDCIYDNVVLHSYFCLTAGEINVNHKLDEIYPLLPANSLEANYYVRENKYFDEYSVKSVRQVVEESFKNNKAYAELRYKTQEEFNLACERLFDNGEIYMVFRPSRIINKSIDVNDMSIVKDDINRTIIFVYDGVK